MRSPSSVRVLLVALLSMVSVAPLAAQEQWALPVDRARVITVGETRASALDASDRKLDDGSFFENWYFEATAGQRVTVTLHSSVFDAYLAIGQHRGEQIASDDDTGEGTDARISITFERAGTYVFRANSLGEGETGAYQISVTAGGSDASSGTAASDLVLRPVDNARRVSVGGSASGSLDTGDGKLSDDSHFELWYLDLRAGQRVAISMQSSAFDAFLHVGRHGSSSSLETDDDGAGGTDAQVTLTATSAGTYVIIANSLGGGATGAYTLSVREAAAGSAGGSGAPARRLEVGRTVSGDLATGDQVLDDGSLYDEYEIEAQAGQTLVITMRSGDFDAYLSLRDASGEVVESNDDGESLGGSTDAQIVFKVERSGRYRVYANSLGDGETGRYTLTLERR